MEKIVLGADIGGSHITAALIDLDKKNEITKTRCRASLNTNAPVEEIIDAWATIIENTMNKHAGRPAWISIAMPGPMDYKNGICMIKDQGKYGALYNVNIKEKLAQRLDFSSDAISFRNDAVCFLQGEIFSGSLKGMDKAIGLTLGTGLGTAYIKNGEAYDADLWKMPFMKGIAEDYISTRWFVNRFEELAEVKIKDVKDLVDNHHNSPYFRSIFTEFSMNLAKFIYKFVRKKMPLAAVIGGNIVQAEAYFLDDTRKYLAQMMGYSFPVKRSVLGEEAALIGAGSSL
ncbi:ROK family protein [Pedobacter miscanthi]|uniref:ROK family protein n=1 Tax=Pedobacter miscanthi TaxID=2259170 RepID=A0A366LC15_9SPHI|nr:ROK family protein [Pedobacter miscanthi]RBQ11396.1 ROK family protein [Pedobacter miscanthi]